MIPSRFKGCMRIHRIRCKIRHSYLHVQLVKVPIFGEKKLARYATRDYYRIKPHKIKICTEISFQTRSHTEISAIYAARSFTSIPAAASARVTLGFLGFLGFLADASPPFSWTRGASSSYSSSSDPAPLGTAGGWSNAAFMDWIARWRSFAFCSTVANTLPEVFLAGWLPDVDGSTAACLRWRLG
jgi:hypothetical protein